MRGSLQQRSKGTWRIRYDGPPEGSGRRKQVSETVRGTKTHDQRVLRERLFAIESGGYVSKSRENVAEFMRGWLAAYVATNTKPSTERGYGRG